MLGNCPEISIGLPVFNGEPFLRDALESLTAQTFKNFEIIISDNASTDNTSEICKEFARSDSRIRYTRQSSNIGASENFKIVLGQAKAEYFIWAAADDTVTDDFLSSLYGIIVSEPDIVLVMSDVANISEDGTFLFSSRLDNIRVNCEVNTQLPFFENPTTNIFFCIYGLFRTNIVKSAQLNFRGLVKFSSGAEIPFLAQIATMGKIASISGDKKMYRRHSSSLYHVEQRDFSRLAVVQNKLNISAVLIRIALASDLEITTKLSMISRTAVSLLGWIVDSMLRSICRALGIQKSNN